MSTGIGDRPSASAAPGPRDARRVRLRGHLGTVLALLALVTASSLVLVGLGRQSYWNDELSSVVRSLPDSPASVVEGVRDDVHPPGYQLALWGWMRLGGTSTETWTRALSALCVLLAIVVVVTGSRRLFGLTPVGALGTGTLLASSWYAFAYSHETRSYGLLLAAAALVTVLGLRCLTRPPTPGLLAALLAASMLASVVHFFGALIGGVTWALLAAQHGARSRWRAAAAALWAVIAGTSPAWLWILYNRETLSDRAGSGFWIGEPTSGLVAEFFELMTWPTPGRIVLWAAACTAASILGAWWGSSVVRHASEDDPDRAVARSLLRLSGWASALFVGCWAVAWSISLHTPVITTRNMIVVVPAATLAIAALVEAGRSGPPPLRSVVTLLGFGVPLVLCVSGFVAHRDDPYVLGRLHQDWRGVTQAALATLGEDPQALLVSGAPEWGRPYWQYYVDAQVDGYPVATDRDDDPRVLSIADAIERIRRDAEEPPVLLIATTHSRPPMERFRARGISLVCTTEEFRRARLRRCEVDGTTLSERRG